MAGSFYDSTEFKRRLEAFKRLGTNSRAKQEFEDQPDEGDGQDFEEDPLDEEASKDYEEDQLEEDSNEEMEDMEEIDELTKNEEGSYSLGSCILEAVDNDDKTGIVENKYEVKFSNSSYKYEMESQEETDSKDVDYEPTPSNNNYICEIDQKSFQLKASLDRHKKTAHDIHPKGKTRKPNSSKKSVPVTNIRDFIIGDDSEPSKNVRVKTEPQTNRYIISDDGRFFCTKCDRSFAQRTDMNKHFRKIHLGLKSPADIEKEQKEAMERLIEYDCEKCDATGLNEKALKKHDKRVHKIKSEVKEETDDPDFHGVVANMNGDEGDLDSFIEDLPSERAGCPECDLVLNKRNVNRHIKRVHRKPLGPDGKPIASDKRLQKMICPQCGFNICKDSIKRHLKSSNCIPRLDREANPLKRLTCWVCSMTLSTPKNKKRHVLTVHDQIALHYAAREKTELCLQCPYSTASRRHLDVHIKAVHEKVKMAICHLCPYKTAYKNVLRTHIRFFHEKIYDYRCERCTYCARTGTKLRQHIKDVHQKIKDEQCHLCPAVFARKANLQEHVRSFHERIRRFKCDLCAYETNRKQNMTLHQNNHENGDGDGENVKSEYANESNLPIPDFSQNNINNNHEMSESTRLNYQYMNSKNLEAGNENDDYVNQPFYNYEPYTNFAAV